MGFIDFYNNFVLNEGFKTHRNVKHKMMSAANKCVSALIRGVKDVSDITLQNIEHLMERYISRSDLYADNPEEADSQYETIRKRINDIKQKKADLKTLYAYYVLYCAAFKERKLSAKSFLPLVNSGAFKVFGDNYTINDTKLVLTKQSRGIRGWWNEDSKRVFIVLPWLSFPNKNKDKWVSSYGFIEAVYRRLTDDAAFEKFVNHLENEVKSDLCHELTHAWQSYLREKGSGQEYIGRNENVFTMSLPFGGEISNLVYQLSPQEIQARRVAAQRSYRTSGKSYIECWVNSLPYTESNYKEMYKTIMFNRASSGILAMTYFMYCVLPKDPTFQSDLKKHTKKNGEYTGTYKKYMEDLEAFKKYKVVGNLTLDDLERAFTNIIKAFVFIKEKSTDAQRQRMQSMKRSIQDECDNQGSSLVNAFSFWSDDAAVKRFKNEIKH